MTTVTAEDTRLLNICEEELKHRLQRRTARRQQKLLLLREPSQRLSIPRFLLRAKQQITSTARTATMKK